MSWPEAFVYIVAILAAASVVRKLIEELV